MKQICRVTGWLNFYISTYIDRSVSACDILHRSGIPLPLRKISISHVNTAFIENVQLDVVYPSSLSYKFTVLHLVDTRTAYSETQIFDNRSADTIFYAIETFWLSRQGNPRCILAEDKLDALNIKKQTSFVYSRDISF